jgi:hypothetical protein
MCQTRLLYPGRPLGGVAARSDATRRRAVSKATFWIPRCMFPESACNMPGWFAEIRWPQSVRVKERNRAIATACWTARNRVEAMGRRFFATLVTISERLELATGGHPRGPSRRCGGMGALRNGLVAGCHMSLDPQCPLNTPDSLTVWSRQATLALRPTSFSGTDRSEPNQGKSE